MEEKLYKIYEYIRDEDEITSEISSTKKIFENEAMEYCIKKSNEEKQEIEEAKIGKHFHKGMSKREILVNEISQYMYWLIVIDVSKKIKYQETKVFEKINEIINTIDIYKIEESREVTLEEVINHDFESMKKKEYLKEVL